MSTLLKKITSPLSITDGLLNNKSIKHSTFGFSLFTFTFFVFAFSSCRKLIETDPPSTQLTQPAVFTSDYSAIGTFNYIYQILGGSGASPLTGGTNSLAFCAATGADELVPFSSSNQFYTNSLIVGTVTGLSIWSRNYHHIYTCNTAIEEMAKSSSLTAPVKTQLQGEAKFVRALSLFYLTNIYGDVPLTLSTDPYVNSSLYRNPQADVYKQIITDLKEAEDLLSSNYLDGTLLNTTTERVRPTKWAAAALLARVYLYTKDYVNAEVEASKVINNTSLFGPLPALNNVFLKNSAEAIWQIQPTSTNQNTDEGKFMVLTTGNTSSGYLSNFLLNNVEAGDKRFVDGNWANTVTYGTYGTVRGAYKYKVNTASGVTTPAQMTEYFMMLRLGEQYLIRAEARALKANPDITGAQADLNAIRNRAGLGNTIANDQASLQTAILKERQVELFCELGHRWFDLKRTGKIDAVMSIVTTIKSGGLPWQPYQALYPIQASEITANSNLIQNPGY